AIALWVTEAIPLAATAVGVILMEVLLISNQAVLSVSEEAPAATAIFGSLANPVIILFMGGFMLADGAAKYNVDKALSALMLKPFLRNARMTVMGVMMITAMSMFMSNTPKAIMFYVVAVITIGLWMTESLHHISSNTVGFIPVAGLMILGVMGGDDVKKLDWPVLW
ncbi:UNVERIFIED_CONTAM: hypothetical protein FO527_30635, partial [Bacillus sp. ATCC 13368]